MWRFQGWQWQWQWWWWWLFWWWFWGEKEARGVCIIEMVLSEQVMNDGNDSKLQVSASANASSKESFPSAGGGGGKRGADTPPSSNRCGQRDGLRWRLGVLQIRQRRHAVPRTPSPAGKTTRRTAPPQGSPLIRGGELDVFCPRTRLTSPTDLHGKVSRLPCALGTPGLWTCQIAPKPDVYEFLPRAITLFFGVRCCCGSTIGVSLALFFILFFTVSFLLRHTQHLGISPPSHIPAIMSYYAQ